MRTALYLLVAILLTPPVWADIKIAGALTVGANHLVRLEAQGDTEGAGLIWDVSPEDSADIEEMGTRFLFAGPAGTYKIKLRAVRVKDGKTTIETARATVVVGDPKPPPPPPPPPDALTAELKSLYTADTGTDKATALANLAAIYRNCGTTIDNQALATTRDLQGKLREATAVLIPDTALVGLRKRLGTEWAAVLGTTPATLTPELRTKAKTLASRLAIALEGVK